MITDKEWKQACKDIRTGKSKEIQGVLDLLKREGGTLTSAQYINAKAQGYNVDGIRIRTRQ